MIGGPTLRPGTSLRTVARAVTLLAAVLAMAMLPACASRASLRRAPGLLTVESRWTVVDGRRVHYLDTGGGPRALVIVHGFAAYSYPFEGIIDSIPTGLRVLAPDLPGHGFSDPLSCEYTMDAMVGFLDGYTKALGLSRFALMGSSMGANIAAHYAAAHPRRVERLVLLSPVGLVGQEERVARISRHPGLMGVVTALIGRGTVRRVLQWAAGGEPELVTPELIEAYALSISTRERRACMRSVVCNIVAGSYLEEILPKISQPVLLIAGDHDPLIREWCLPEFRRLLTDERVVVFSGGGHLLHQQFPIEIAGLVGDFLSTGSRWSRLRPEAAVSLRR